MNTRHVATLAAVMLTLSACTPAIDQATRITSDPFGDAGAHPQADTSPSNEASTSQSGATPQSGATSAADRIPLPPVPTLPSVSGTLVLVVDEEASLPQALVDDFAEATGASVEVHTLRADDAQVAVDAFIGFDGASLTDSHKAGLLADAAPTGATATHPLPGVPAAVDYARDDVCVIADQQWYELNKIDMPKSFAALSSPEDAKRLVLAPAQSSVARAFTDHVTQALGSQAATWLTQVKASALAPTSWDEAAHASTVRLQQQDGVREVPGRTRWAGGERATAASSQADQGTHPLRVAPVSVAAQATTNTQTSGYAHIIDGSCAERPIYIVAAQHAHNPGAVEAFAAYVTSPRAQRILALTGGAIPRNADMIPDSVVDWYAHY